jgi:hypothetical protein
MQQLTVDKLLDEIQQAKSLGYITGETLIELRSGLFRDSTFRLQSVGVTEYTEGDKSTNILFLSDLTEIEIQERDGNGTVSVAPSIN